VDVPTKGRGRASRARRPHLARPGLCGYAAGILPEEFAGWQAAYTGKSDPHDAALALRVNALQRIPDNITGRQRKPHSRTAHTIGDETAGLAARRKTQIFEAVANGGGLSYMHSGMYGRGSVRQMRSTAPAQIPGTKISVCRGVGGMFTASGTIIMPSRHSAVVVSIAR
jgi:hypothetical protein